MPSTVINLIKGDTVGAETDYRDALMVNMVAVPRKIFGVEGYVIQYPGLTQYGNLTDKARGGIWNERFKNLYRINGENLYRVNQDGTSVPLGSVSGSTTVSLPYSFNTQGIVSNGRFFLYDEVNGLREVTDPDLGRPIDCVWIDGYYFFTDGENIYHTLINDESAIDPLQFATAEFMPDDSLGVAKTQDNKVAVFGRYTIEYFQNVATENFAFQRLPSRAIKLGIVGTHCKTELGPKFYVLGGRKEESVSCHAVIVGNSQKIATREIDKIIGQYNESQLSNSVVETYSEDGINYVVYHLPNETLLFNETIANQFGINQAWTVLDSGKGNPVNYVGIHYVNDIRLGKWTLGNKLNGTISILDETTPLQNGEMARWEMFSPFYYLESASIDQLEIEILPGFNDQGDAKVFMHLTYDGVFNTKPDITFYGQEANYSNRYIVRRLGYVSDWTAFKLGGLTRSRMAFSRAFINYG